MSTKLAPRNADQAAAFIKHQHQTRANWRRMCLSLQRQARGLPAVYPSALSAALATPKSERVTKVADLRHGMIAYSDDPNDSNPAGHVYYIAGWSGPKSDPSNLLTWSNDVTSWYGGVGLVPITYYKANWGDGFQFGATWLNGYDFADFNKAPKPEPHRAKLGDNYAHALDDIERALAYHRKKGHKRLVKALERDVARMKRRIERFS